MYRNDCLHLFHHVVDHSLSIENIQQFLKDKAFIEICQFYEERFGEKYCQLSSNNNYCNTISDKNNLLNYSQASYSYWNQTFFEFSSNPSTHYENPFSFSAAEIIFDGCWLDLCKRFICNSLQRSGVHYNNEIFTFDIDLGTDAMKL
ncbi:unnamed protein product [Rotaria sp. Silwood2]|nr:unnamed protein product [Rotaria sp. Silwood2]CAF3004437.1 unnamed protein product [Rotaria sp. Silwood2]CAF4077168.1 unnamed protein product [Rotaria sp. Silwood2]CAF4401301.1 unnamed protein product [Rotaria sp. Silwood2]